VHERAVVVDTTGLTIDEAVDQVIGLLPEERRNRA
jgi:hypothetical protein